MSHRDQEIVVTGIGVVSTVGTDRESFWESLVEGRCSIRPLRLFDPTRYRTQTGAWIEEDALDCSFLTRRERARTSRADRFALVAAREAITDSGVELATVPPHRGAVVFGSGAGGLFEAESWYRGLALDGRPGKTREILAHGPDFITNRVASHLGLTGFRCTVTTACSSATLAIGQAADLLRAGLADVALTGGSDSLARLTYGGFNSLRSVDSQPCRPFDRERKGLSMGEGAGMLILERRGDAERRGAHIYCAMAGYGVTADAYHMTAPEPSGEAAARTLSAALRHSGVNPDEIDYINAHGTATPHNDSAEAAGIHRVFGDRASKLPTSSIKSMIGHCLCSAGAVEAAATALTVERGIAPPTLHYENPDPACDLDVIPDASREMPVRAALSSSFAFGGNSAALVMRSVR